MANYPSLAPNSAQNSAQTGDRLYFLDWLRIAAFAALVLYHVGMYYVPWTFHVKSPFATGALVPWMKLTEPWRMSLIFMISGVATAHLFKQGVTAKLIRERSRFLLLPLLCGLILVVPPQAYFEAQGKYRFAGNYFDFLSLYFTGYRGFCNGSSCLILPTWNHLWFLPYLWLYTILIAVAVRLQFKWLNSFSLLASLPLRWTLFLVGPIFYILLLRLTLFQRYPQTHALLNDWFAHTLYFGFFLLGFIIGKTPRIWNFFLQARFVALLTALSFWAVLVFVRPARPLEHLVVAVFSWSAIVAAFGFARRYLNFDSRLRARLVQAVFPVYVLHQTILIAATRLLLPLVWPAWLEAVVLIVITFLLSYIGYHAISKVRFLRPWFGVKLQ